jgi:hypothetical protein
MSVNVAPLRRVAFEDVITKARSVAKTSRKCGDPTYARREKPRKADLPGLHSDSKRSDYAS